METPYSFDEIRSYNDSEVAGAFSQLLANEQFLKIIPLVFPGVPAEQVVALFGSLNSIDEEQTKIILPFFENLLKKTLSSFDIIGLDKLGNDRDYTYISNHRDIILDSALFNIFRHKAGLPTTEIAIGDNLFVQKWVEIFVRVNRAFIVKRNLPLRELLTASAVLSAYIRHTIQEKRRSVWIAQREGRAKNSDDRTQPALLKMLAMSGKGSYAESLKELNIVPMTISYEYDPSDFLKAKEFQQKRDNPDYKKTQQDDAIHMLTGLLGWKGEVRYAVNGDINAALNEIAGTIKDKNQQIEAVAEVIDKRIHADYTIFASNEIALDMLALNIPFKRNYKDADKKAFQIYLQEQIDKIDLPNKDEDFLRTKMLEMYANPLINYLNATI
ncbi:MAG: acyltransferase [Prevotellaceae bacterium]|jgi:hypothetical protein|nr:acyltransferase [Prevotellaceae bacterium]